MKIACYLIIFLIGVNIGSLANICIYRIPLKEPIIFHGSRCTSCRKRLKAIDLIPVLSYYILGRECRYCGEKISFKYPLVEIISGFVFVLIFYKFGFSAELFFYEYFCFILLVIAFIDLEHRIIPNGLVIAGIIGGLAVFIYNLFILLDIYRSTNLWSPLIGILPGTLFLFLVLVLGTVIYKSDDVLGMGDVKLFIPIGLFLGWRVSILALLLSVMTGGIISVALILLKVKKRKDTIPFAPFISISAFVSLLWGWDIIFWYLSVC